MGCDIHIITEIKKEGKWQYVPEVPESLDQRNYHTFSFLATEVRNSFDTQGFAPRGLPEDISGMKFNFTSDSPYHLRRYEEDSDLYLKTADGKYLKRCGDKTQKAVIEVDKEFYEKVKENPDERYRCYYSSTKGADTQYYVKDAAVLNGKWVVVPNKEAYDTFEEFERDNWGEDEWDEIAQDYGHWDVNFACEDYHTPSWLSLKDLLDADYTDFTSHKYKLDRQFYEKFKESGGVFPDCFTVQEKSCIGDIADAFREVFSPTVLIAWQMSEDEKSKLALLQGVEELKEIAKKYNVKNPEDIRIVFAFDN